MSRILIVEDRDSLRDMLVTFLKEHDVLAAASAEEAEGLLIHVPEIVLCDHKLPGKTGIDFIRDHQSALSDSIVIVMTAFGDIPTAVMAMKAGAHDFLPKPLDLDHLKLVIRKAQDMIRLKRLQPDIRTVHVVAESAEMKQVLDVAGKFARTDHTILLSGESGSGKEVVARWIHQNSSRKEEPFQAINCAAIPEGLLESELYGHVPGAFTGATRKRIGQLERADKGTLFLDEIGATSPAFQAKILRSVETGEYDPLGDNRTRHSNARIILATNRDLTVLVSDGQFREDLYHRIGSFQIHIPALRHRVSDIGPLATLFADIIGTQLHGHPMKLNQTLIQDLQNRNWPGNVRELRNTIERWAILGPEQHYIREEVDTPGMLQIQLDNQSRDAVLEHVETALIRHALKRCKGNKLAASRDLKMNYKTMLNRMKKLGIQDI